MHVPVTKVLVFTLGGSRRLLKQVVITEDIAYRRYPPAPQPPGKLFLGGRVHDDSKKEKGNSTSCVFPFHQSGAFSFYVQNISSGKVSVKPTAILWRIQLIVSYDFTSS